MLEIRIRDVNNHDCIGYIGIRDGKRFISLYARIMQKTELCQLISSLHEVYQGYVEKYGTEYLLQR